VTTDAPKAAPPGEPPPFAGSWRALYALVVLELAAIVVLCWALTRITA